MCPIFLKLWVNTKPVEVIIFKLLYLRRRIPTQLSCLIECLWTSLKGNENVIVKDELRRSWKVAVGRG